MRNLKSKIFSIVFTLSLTLSCTIALTACGENPPEDSSEWTTITQATCETDGLKQRTINGVLEEETIPALGHNYGQWITTQNETCTVDGTKTQTCSRCQGVKTETLPAHHTLDGTIKFNETEHWQHCTKCTEKVNSTPHNFQIKSTSNNILFDAYRNIGEYKHITCSDCDVEIEKSKLITKSNGTISSGSIDYISTIFTATSSVKFHYYDFMKDVPLELCYDKYYKAGVNMFLTPGNCSISYDTATNSITYLYIRTYIGTLGEYLGFRVYLNENLQPKTIKIIASTGQENPNGAYVEIEQNSNTTTYNIYAEISDSLYSKYVFDNNDRLISYILTSSPILYNFTYDEKGFLVKVENGETFAVIEEYKNCTYDTYGNRTGFDYYSNGEFVYSARANFNANNQIVNLHYDIAPNQHSSSYYTDVTTEFTYDNNGKLTMINRTGTQFYISEYQTVSKKYICENTDTSLKIIDFDNSDNYYIVEWQETTKTNIEN